MTRPTIQILAGGLLALALAGCGNTTSPDAATGTALTYAVVDTGLTTCYNASGLISAPRAGEPFYGQDGQQTGLPPAYRDNGDGTVSDPNTGLMWVQARGSKVAWEAARTGASACRVGGYSDWRMPAIKELYSLIQFTGRAGQTTADSTPYLDTRYFGFAYGDVSAGERVYDCQDWSATAYVGTTMNGDATAFGVNFADGRIKGYPLVRNPAIDPAGGSGDFLLYARYVRGNPAYGQNRFLEPGDGTITDEATGLMWTREDSGSGMNWQEALAWVQARNADNHLGHSDWRLPNAKELQSLVDYTRAPEATDALRRGPAIDPILSSTSIIDEGGGEDYPFFWTSTTHLEGLGGPGSAAVYVAFGRALGFMQTSPGTFHLWDVHGAGAQRSDPKAGDPAAFPRGFGPQGDVIRIRNFVRLVRNAS